MSANVSLFMSGQLDLASYNETIGPLTVNSGQSTLTAIARPGRAKTVKDIMTTRVITTNLDEHVDIVARKLEHYNVSALPVVDPNEKVLGMLTAIDLGKLFGGRWLK